MMSKNGLNRDLNLSLPRKLSLKAKLRPNFGSKTEVNLNNPVLNRS